MYQVPTQFARFLEGDSVALIAAASLDRIPLGPVRTVFLVSDGPGSYPVGLQPRTRGPGPVVEAVVAPVPMVASLEFVDAEQAAARSRVGIPPLATEGLVLSDPLLLIPDSLNLPNSRDEAVATMMGTTTIESGDELAIYWEVYGVVRGQPLEFSISIAGVQDGFFTRVLRSAEDQRRRPGARGVVDGTRQRPDASDGHWAGYRRARGRGLRAQHRGRPPGRVDGDHNPELHGGPAMILRTALIVLALPFSLPPAPRLRRRSTGNARYRAASGTSSTSTTTGTCTTPSR